MSMFFSGDEYNPEVYYGIGKRDALNEIYLITRIDFDTLENDIFNAISKCDLGIVYGKSVAANTTDKLNRLYGYKYEGWDNKKYPRFESTRLNKFNLNMLDEKGFLREKRYGLLKLTKTEIENKLTELKRMKKNWEEANLHQEMMSLLMGEIVQYEELLKEANRQ